MIFMQTDGDTPVGQIVHKRCRAVDGVDDEAVAVGGIGFPGFLAEKGKGAYLNGTRIHVSNADTLVESIVGTGFYCLREGWKEENNLKFFARVAPLVADIRKYGSAALDACHVASGSLEAWWELCLAPYDIAAGALILTEAGGTVTDLHGGNEYPHRGILGSNGKIHNTMLEFFQDFKELHR